MKDIFGRIWEMQNNEGNIFPYYTRGTMNTIEKWEQFKQELPDLTIKYSKFGKRFYRKINKKYGDKIFIMITTDFAGIFESASQGMGLDFFSRSVVKNPGWIKDVFETLADFNIAVFNAYMDAGAEVLIEAGDLAYKDRPMMSPKTFDALLMPAYKRVVESVHQRGQKIVLHSDGQITPLLDFAMNCGFDGLHSLEPSAGVDLGVVKEKVGNKMCLMGNIDTGHVLTHGSKQDVENAVKHAIKTAAPGGGFILSAANMHPAVKVQNLKWMVEAAKKFGNYPLDLE